MTTGDHRRTYCDCAAWLANYRCDHVHTDDEDRSVRIDTRADVDLIAGNSTIVSLCSDRHSTLVDRTPASDLYQGHDVVVTVESGALGAIGGLVFTLPFLDIAEYVDQVRDGGLDGFEDALNHLLPRGRSRKYIDAYTLGQVEARGRAE
ncbi:hypothetical protein BJD61_gp51 [Gordonia phage Obliviate]|uniref:hypothetical protein n=1 Tax=Gordonia phage Obliviate TaxID=1821559 RepID=UPI00078E1A35|nr:hypothetical protein BJD61_gp51 [Gordonia phage Obliviate]AMS03130.1 hypothetical protein SEA_OBLIVIATE_51 [Gordonia phage Obliviate]